MAKPGGWKRWFSKPDPSLPRERSESMIMRTQTTTAAAVDREYRISFIDEPAQPPSLDVETYPAAPRMIVTFAPSPIDARLSSIATITNQQFRGVIERGVGKQIPDDILSVATWECMQRRGGRAWAASLMRSRTTFGVEIRALVDDVIAYLKGAPAGEPEPEPLGPLRRRAYDI